MLIRRGNTESNAECERQMLEYLTDDDTEGFVGIFWYDKFSNTLFGVRKQEVITLTQGTTYLKTHEQIWAKELNKAKGQNKVSKFRGDYRWVPRGRVFYYKSENQFKIGVGSWIEDYPKVKELVIKEFELENTDYYFEIEHHWELGQGWEG
jgi:hypothetical protein